MRNFRCPRAFISVCAGAAMFTLRSASALAQSGALPNQSVATAAIPAAPSSTPRGNDTSGYWQQRADYTIVATLDERLGGIRASGTLHYVNQSPDTLRELWVHQHLNAFRPGSRWSSTDEREGRKRFQTLTDPDFAFERFTALPRIGTAVLTPEYPLSPDSSVIRFVLPKALLSGDSVNVLFAWEARPSTVARRQGRRGRSYDFSQWFPKVAVYDRAGWHPNALVPAGEFYGEFGTFDVTLVLPNDEVVGATGVPVSGDPGWARVALPGSEPPRLGSNAYRDVPLGPVVTPGNGYRVVRFYARNVHHFVWSVSPGFRYEGTTWVRAPAQAWRFPIWDTVSVHALYRADAADDCSRANAASVDDEAKYAKAVNTCIATARTQWEQGKALRYGLQSLRWLEALYGDYPYPQLTMLKRIDGGGTEFPMVVENGSASLDLTLHEVGHIFTYGILANNEWQSGWMDEGLTSYQTALQQGQVRVLLAARLAMAQDRDPSHPRDTALVALRHNLDSITTQDTRLVRDGIAQPIGTRADLFRSFTVYNSMVYDRGQAMYQALHDVIGEDAFQTFLRDYYAQWQFRHVDRWAMQGAAERAHKHSLDWFFDQWVSQSGNIDYALRTPTVTKVGTQWVVRVQLTRSAGSYRHPMPVAVRTSFGWTVVRADALKDTQVIEVRVNAAPDAVWLDPFGATDSPTAKYYRLSLPTH